MNVTPTIEFCVVPIEKLIDVAVVRSMLAVHTGVMSVQAQEGSESEVLYRALIEPKALAIWLLPGEMTGKIHEFSARVGGGYRMSLFYPSSEQEP